MHRAISRHQKDQLEGRSQQAAKGSQQKHRNTELEAQQQSTQKQDRACKSIAARQEYRRNKFAQRSQDRAISKQD